VTTIITPIAAVDAIQRVPVDCWVGPSDHPAGFPNYPVWPDAAGQPVDTLDQATHALWDGQFGGLTARLLAAIGADPARVPADTSTLDRAALIALYPEAVPEPEVTP
jgi:hypothetical protein